MPGFFLKKKKRKAAVKGNAGKAKKISKQEVESETDESIISGDEEVAVSEAELSEEETAQEKRLRIAKEYINKLEEEEQEKKQDKNVDADAIAHRLQQDVLEDAGHLQKFIADKITPDVENMKCLRGHKLSVTCLVVSTGGKFIFSASKDGTIIKWDRCTKMEQITGSSKETSRKCHTGQVLCLALTSDFQYLASGGQDKLIHIWKPDDLSWIHTFKGHRAQISGLTFRNKQHQLFSASHDKTLKVWSLNEMAYVETLFGHEDTVLGVDSLIRDVAVSCGGRDRSIRLWKIPEESQLVFHSKMGASFDCVTMLNEEFYLAGADDGSLSLFHCRKKKPITLRTNAHKRTSDTTSCCSESWVSAVTCIPFTDLVATGSCDGCIKLWRCEKSFRAIMPIHSINMPGFVNSLQFSADGKYLIAGVGQEHRLGRWWKIKEAKNAVYVIPIVYKEQSDT